MIVIKLNKYLKCEKYDEGLKIIFSCNGNPITKEIYLPNKIVKFLYKISEW